MFQPRRFVGRRERTVASNWPVSSRWRWPITSGNTGFIEIRMKDNSTVKAKSLNPKQGAVRSNPKALASEEKFAALDERIMTALHAASEKKAIDTVVLDLRE